MKSESIRFFLDPKSVAVMGVSKQGGFSWGRAILEQVVRSSGQRKIYLTNRRAEDVIGIKAYPDLASIPGEVELVIIAIPVQSVLAAMEDCVKKGVKAVMIVTAGFGETPADEGKELQDRLFRMARSNGIRIVGPNVSGIFDAATGFNGSALHNACLKDVPIAFTCQGGFAVANLLQRGHDKGMGVGKYMHTGNECDLTSVDLLEYLEDDSTVEVILMYVEGFKEGRRFFEVAKRVGRKKPIIALKSGGTGDGARAAFSHTGVLAGSDSICEAVFKQANIVRAPKLEIMLEMGYAFLELPPLRNNRIGIVTVGGTWGVLMSDALARKGLKVSEPSHGLQEMLRKIGTGMPYWVSTRNPIDIGAAGRFLDVEGRLKVIETLLAADEIDGVVVHGIGSFGFASDQGTGVYSFGQAGIFEMELAVLRRAFDLIPKYNKPLLVCTFPDKNESETVQTLLNEGKRIYHDVEDTATILAGLYAYHSSIRGACA